MDSFLSEFEEASKTELRWLRELYQFVEDNLCTVTGHNAGYSAAQLALAVVRRVQRAVGTKTAMLPVGYRLVSVSELVTRQHTFCCSHLTWTTTEYREWTKEAEGVLSNYKALSPAYLLLIGFLIDGSSEPGVTCDGTWKVMDGSGSVTCEVLNPSPEWLGQLMLFPSWNYIPQHASGQGQEPKGYLEMSASPLSLVPSPKAFDPGGSLSKLMGTGEAAKVLGLRERQRGVRLHVFGQICTVCPLLEIGVKSFFCFCLKEGDSTVPVLVMDPGCLRWRQCVHVATFVCVSGLRVCGLREWPGHKVLCATPESRLQVLKEPPAALLTWEEALGSSGHHGKTGLESQGRQDMETDTQSEAGTQTDKEKQAEMDTQSGMQTITTLPQNFPVAKTKISKMISYKGVVSKVLNSEAGLYEIDGTVGLCLAYQPLQRGGHRLRPGAEIELHDVHFLYRPSPHALPTMLCACLRSSIRVISFSRLETELTSCHPRDSPALCLLLERNLGVSQYLWLCHCLSALRERLCPRWVREGRLRAAARRLLSCVVPPGWEGGRPRELYKEMLEEPHCCPLTEYSVDSPSCELISMRDLRSWMEGECWDSMSLPSLLPASAPHLTRAALNPLLAWSVHVLSAGTLPKPKVLVGVLRVSGRGPCIQLEDQTGVMDCVVVEKRDDQSYCAAYNTAWLDCLVCVQRYALVMERFLTADFPAWTHLDQERYITHRHSRLYIQLCLDDLTVLRPSVAMAKFLSSSNPEKGREGEQQRDECAPHSSADQPGGSQGSERSSHLRKERESHKQATEEPVLSAVTGNRPKLSVDQTNRRTRPGEERTAKHAKRARKDDKDDNLKSKTRTVEDKQENTGSGERGMHKPPLTDPACSLTSGWLKVAPPVPCVSVVFCVESKEGLAFRNVQVSEGDPRLSLCFGVSAVLLGGVQKWRQDPKNCPVEQRETTLREAQNDRVELQFVGECVRWYPLLQLGCVYRIVAPHTEDPGVLRGCGVPTQGGAQLQSVPTVLVQPRWHLHTLPLQQGNGRVHQKVTSVSEVLCCSTTSSLVSFEGVICQRIPLLEEKGKTLSVQSELREKGVDVEQTLNVRLTVQDVLSPGQSMQVYADLSQRPFTPGLVPGATVLFQTFQRKVSRIGCVYCRSVPLSCVTVTALAQAGSAELRTPPPIMHLGEWALKGAQHCGLARVRAHVACVLYLQLQWVCSLCSSVFKQDACTRNYPPCTSTTGVFQADAKAVVEDGTAEAQVWFSSQTVSHLLALSMTEWEGLQRLVRVRGHLRVHHQGRSVGSDVASEDPLLQYLSYLCVCAAVCRSVTLTCELRSRSQGGAAHGHENTQLKRFTRGDREFITRIPAPLQLQCTELREWESSM
ncbi:CST complex subunit CTC1 [Anguilla rostrata]|uniref:CST complex subunit CTC1 n=1 Tax=Anguilla rostrata TaxID=7938 RepID=UPI0030D2D3AF